MWAEALRVQPGTTVGLVLCAALLSSVSFYFVFLLCEHGDSPNVQGEIPRFRSLGLAGADLLCDLGGLSASLRAPVQ